MLALYFRTDHAIGRKANGKSLDASAGLHGPTEQSVGTENAAKHCYVSYLRGGKVTVGAKHNVHVMISGTETVRSVRTARDDGGAAIGC